MVQQTDSQNNRLKKSLLATMLIICSFSTLASPHHSKGAEPTDKKIHLNGITLTPGGFFAGEGLWRSRNEESDTDSTFSGIPLQISPLAHMKEFRLSARQTRLSLLAEGNYLPTLLSGYVELDFLGNGTANSNESNSFNPRIRNMYVTVDQKCTGWHMLAGQNWSLATTNAKGITPRNEPIPQTIDFQYVVGYVWKRQPQFRLTKDFCEKVWAAISIENPQTTLAGISAAGFNDIVTITASAPGAQSLPSTTNFSINHVPDVIAKLAVENVVAERNLHLEVFGIYRDLYDRVQYLSKGSENKNKTAGGVGAGMLLDVIPKRLDLQANILVGKGIGSYASGALPDATVDEDGSLVGISEVAFMIGATLHATRALDFYVFGGAEREKSRFFQNGTTFLGLGLPTANNATCDVENGAASGCTGATRKLWQVTGGLWNKICQGSAGELSAGLQYSYTRKELFPGTNNGQPNTDDNMVFASLRYYPFKVPA